MLVEINKEYDEITMEMSLYINDNNLEVIRVGDKFKVIPYVPPVSQQLIQLKSKLTATDYQAIKFAEGTMTEAEFAPVREQRQAWREEINRLEEVTENGTTN